MITFLTGEVVSVTERRLVLDVGGVGFQISITTRDSALLPEPGERVRIYTCMNVREDAISLFGFLSEDDLSVYRMLINVSGIGPKGGLAILSAMSADDLRLAVLAEDAKAISKAPGIGLKTAQKLILELKDKLDTDAVLIRHAKNAENAEFEANRAEAISMMTALGYSMSEAMRAVRHAVLTEDMSADEILRCALKESL